MYNCKQQIIQAMLHSRTTIYNQIKKKKDSKLKYNQMHQPKVKFNKKNSTKIRCATKN